MSVQAYAKINGPRIIMAKLKDYRCISMGLAIWTCLSVNASKK